MVIDERARHQLHGRLDEVLGQEEAATLMAHLPPVGWADVSTKHDLDQLAAATKRDLDVLGGVIRGEMAELGGQLRSEMAELRGELRHEISELRAEMHRELASMHKEIGALRGEMSKQTRTVIFSMLSAMLLVAVLAFGAAQLT